MRKIALATLAIAFCTTSTGVYAAPKVYGQIGARVIDQNDKDRSMQAYDVRLGVKGKGKYNGVTALYQLEAELTAAINDSSTTSDDDDERQITRARLLFPSQYGVFVVAPKTPSGQQKDLYGVVDIFETNEAHSENGVSSIFDQGETVTHVLAYVTPKIFGDLKAWPAT